MSEDLAKKFGLRPGQLVGLVNAPPNSAALLRASCPPGVKVLEPSADNRCDQLFYWPRQLEEITQRIGELQQRIHPVGAIWVVLPKKKYAGQRGINFTWEQMQAAALLTDLVDNKVATLSEQEYGTRFVIRKALRPKYAVHGSP